MAICASVPMLRYRITDFPFAQLGIRAFANHNVFGRVGPLGVPMGLVVTPSCAITGRIDSIGRN